MNKMEYILTESITKPKNYYNYGMRVEIEVKDDRAMDILEDYANKKISRSQFIVKMIELINSITDERDHYRSRIENYERQII